MALLKMGAIVTALSGKIGGQTIGIGQSGQYIKNTGSYINQSTPKRKKSNAAIYAVTSTWRRLNAVDQSTWNALSPSLPYTNRVGNVEYYSGFNLFTQFNYNLNLIGAPNSTTAPAVSLLVAPSALNVNWTGTKLEVTTPDGDDAVICVISATPALSTGDSQYKKRLRFLTLQDNLAVKGTYDLTAAYKAVFLDFVGDSKVYVSARFFDGKTGQPLGTYLNGFVIIT